MAQTRDNRTISEFKSRLLGGGARSNLFEVELTPSQGLDIGLGKNEILKTKIFGGVVGIILDGRGRQPFNLTQNTENRVEQLKEWSEETNEYPQLENSNV